MKKEDRIYKKAKKRVAQKKAFYQSSGLFALITIGLVFTAFKYTPHNVWWVSFPILGFLIASFIQYTEVYGLGFFGDEWEEKELEKEVAKEKYKQDLKDYLDDPQSSELDELELREIELKHRKDDFV